MKVIFNQTESKNKKARIDFVVGAENKKIDRRRNIRLGLGVTSTVLLGIYVITNIFIYRLPEGLGLPITLFVFLSIFPIVPGDKVETAEMYSEDIKYYVATENKKVLESWVEDESDGFVSFKVKVEDKDHTVSSEKIGIFPIVENTSVVEPTIDLTNNKYLIPYKRKNEQTRNPVEEVLNSIGEIDDCYLGKT